MVHTVGANVCVHIVGAGAVAGAILVHRTGEPGNSRVMSVTLDVSDWMEGKMVWFHWRKAFLAQYQGDSPIEESALPPIPETDANIFQLAASSEKGTCSGQDSEADGPNNGKEAGSSVASAPAPLSKEAKRANMKPARGRMAVMIEAEQQKAAKQAEAEQRKAAKQAEAKQRKAAKAEEVKAAKELRAVAKAVKQDQKLGKKAAATAAVVAAVQSAAAAAAAAAATAALVQTRVESSLVDGGRVLGAYHRVLTLLLAASPLTWCCVMAGVECWLVLACVEYTIQMQQPCLDT